MINNIFYNKNKKFWKISLSVFFTTVLSATLVSCSDTNQLVAAGSTTLMPLLENLTDKYNNESHSNSKISVLPGGSTMGISFIRQGLTNIGNASRFPIQQEYSSSDWKNISTSTIGYDSLIFGVNLRNTGYTTLNKKLILTNQDISNIYFGKYKTWAQLAQSDPNSNLVATGLKGSSEIKVLSREEGSGTRDAFYNAMKNYNQSAKPNNLPDNANITRSNGQMLSVNQNVDGSIGYFSFGNLSLLKNYPSIQIASINFSETSEPNIIDFTVNDFSDMQNISLEIWKKGIANLEEKNSDTRYWYWHPLNICYNIGLTSKSSLTYKFISWMIKKEYEDASNTFCSDENTGMYFIPGIFHYNHATFYLSQYIVSNIYKNVFDDEKILSVDDFLNKWVFVGDNNPIKSNVDWWN